MDTAGKQLQASLANAEFAAEKGMTANELFALIDEARAELGDDGALVGPPWVAMEDSFYL